MNKICFIIFISFIFPLAILAQSKVEDCSKLKNGKFYLYTQNHPIGYLIIRKDSIQEEVNLQTNDTSFWKVSWKNVCDFDFKFIRKSHPISYDEQSFYNSHTTKCRVQKIETDYYIFKGGLDSINNSSAVIDTIWFKPRKSF